MTASAYMSEKAKGKQREVAPGHSQGTLFSSSASNKPDSQQPQPQERQLVVRFTEGYPDLVITVARKDSVRDVKSKIRTTRPTLQQRRLRLIYAGRLLTDGILLYEWLERLEAKTHRASASSEGGGSADDSDIENSSTSDVQAHVGKVKVANKEGKGKAQKKTTWIHCSVGPTMESGEVDDEEQKESTQIRPVRGLDRLASIGFTPADIASVRAQLHAQAEGDASEGDVEFSNEEEYQEHVRALEEQWIDSLDNTGAPSTLSSSSSSSSSFLQGVITGFFFPILPFFFMRTIRPAVFWDNGVEFDGGKNVIFSRKMQMGLVIGLVVNILFGWWRLLLDGS